MAKTTLCSCILAMSVLFLILELCIAQQPVKVLNSGPDNTCPSESQVISARNELINNVIIGLTEDNPATTLLVTIGSVHEVLLSECTVIFWESDRRMDEGGLHRHEEYQPPVSQWIDLILEEFTTKESL